jgi:hypothetical protein
MRAKTWNALKGKVMAVHGSNIDWWEVRVKVNKIMAQYSGFSPGDPGISPVDAFNIAYKQTPLPYRKNNPDGSPTALVVLEYGVALMLLLVIVFAAYAFLLFGIMLVTALILGGVTAVVRFFHR